MEKPINDVKIGDMYFFNNRLLEVNSLEKFGIVKCKEFREIQMFRIPYAISEEYGIDHSITVCKFRRDEYDHYNALKKELSTKPKLDIRFDCEYAILNEYTIMEKRENKLVPFHMLDGLKRISPEHCQFYRLLSSHLMCDETYQSNNPLDPYILKMLILKLGYEYLEPVIKILENKFINGREKILKLLEILD
jgi:hypothetical protein